MPSSSSIAPDRPPHLIRVLTSMVIKSDILPLGSSLNAPLLTGQHFTWLDSTICLCEK